MASTKAKINLALPADWVDPRTGERTAARLHGQSAKTPDGWEDAVLLFER